MNFSRFREPTSSDLRDTEFEEQERVEWAEERMDSDRAEPKENHEHKS